MKNTFKLIGIIVISAIIGFDFTACTEEKPETNKELPALTGVVSISGTAQVGQTLTALVSALGGSGTITYQWKRGTVNVGNNNGTYVLQTADLGSSITVTVTRAGNTGSVTSMRTNVVIAEIPALTGTVSITGAALVGETLTANTSDLRGTGAISYRWEAGGVIVGTDSAEYSVRIFDVGSSITVTVTRAGRSGSVVSSATAVVVFNTPTGVTAVAASSSSVTVSWSSVSGATGYYVYRSLSSSGTYSQVGTSTTTSYTNTGLLANTMYYYRVTAYNNNGESAQSSTVSATTLGIPPSNPTGVTATASSSSSITISWTSVSGATGYRIYRSSSSTGTYSQVGTPTATSYTDTGLSANTMYFYKVSAVNNNGESAQSSTVSATTSIGVTGTESNPIQLSSGIWVNGSITSSASNGAVWYSFNATAGSAYYLWWNDNYEGDGTKTLDIVVTIYNPNGNIGLNREDSSWSSSTYWTANSSGTLKIKVEPYASGNTGTFGIVYRVNNNTRPGGDGGAGTETNPIQLSSGVWANGSIFSSASNAAVWYSFKATAGSAYYLWWNDRYEGDGTKTLDIVVTIYNPNGSIRLNRGDSSWSSSTYWTANSSGTVYIKVEPYAPGNIGSTFGIVYRANNNTRPW